MADGPSSGSWTSIIKSVRTPLGLIVLLSLIVNGLLVVVRDIPYWAPLGLLALIVVAVFVTMMINPKALYHPSDWPAQESAMTLSPMKVRLRVNANPPFRRDGQPYKASYTIRRGDGSEEPKERVDARWEGGGYLAVELDDVYPDDRVSASVANKHGELWEVQQFPLGEQVRRAVVVSAEAEFKGRVGGQQRIPAAPAARPGETSVVSHSPSRPQDAAVSAAEHPVGGGISASVGRRRR